MATEEDPLVFVVAIDFVSGPALPPLHMPATSIRADGDTIAIASNANVTTVHASKVRSITLTPMTLSDARHRQKGPR